MERDYRLDTIKGLLLIIITIDHFGGTLKKLTWQTFGFVSAAEAFILISGFVFAIICKKYNNNHASLTKRTYKRAIEIYTYHLSLLIVMPCIAFLIPGYNGAWEHWLALYYQNPGEYFLYSILFLHHPLYMSILPMYSIFMLISPLIIKLLNKRQYKMVVGPSFLLWLLGQTWDPLAHIAYHIDSDIRPGFFNIITWQFLFFFGLSAGHYLLNRNSNTHKVAWGPINMKTLSATLMCLLVILFLTRHQFIILPFVTEVATHIPNLGWLRLLNTLLLAAGVAIFLQKTPKTWHNRWLSFLGQHSLQVFAFHVFLFYTLTPIGWKVREHTGEIGHTAYVILVTFSLTLPAYIHHKFQKIRSQ